MKSALNQLGQLVYAVQIKDEQDGPWYCPLCHQRVILKKSMCGNPYFAHLIACHQEGLSQRLSPSESQQHHQGKILIAQQFQGNDYQVKIEQHLPVIFQTADVMVSKGNLNDIRIYEFQNTPISFQILNRRNNLYSKITNKIYWYGNYDYFTHFKKTSWLQNLLKYNPLMDYFEVPTLDLVHGKVIHLVNLPLIFQISNYVFKEAEIDLKTGKILTLRTRQRQLQFTPKCGYGKCLKIIRQRSYRPIINQLYQEGIILTELPQVFFECDWECLLTDEPIWLSLAWVYADIKGLPKEFEIHQLIEQGSLWRQIRFAPSFDQHALGKERTVESILEIFVKMGILRVKEEQGIFSYRMS